MIELSYCTDKQANKGNPNKDKLNYIQRAFVKAKAKELVNTGSTVTTAFVNQLIREGVEERLWTQDFSPPFGLRFRNLFNEQIEK